MDTTITAAAIIAFVATIILWYSLHLKRAAAVRAKIAERTDRQAPKVSRSRS